MAIGGDNNNSSSKNKMYEPTYYPRLRFRQAEGKLALGYTFRSGLLVFEIAEQKEDFKYDTITTVHLSPTKARMLAEEIDLFKKYLATGTIIEGKAFGVNAGMGEKVSYIGFHASLDGIPHVTIGKIDGQGNITEQATMMLNNNYHFALEWDNINTMDVSKRYINNIEIDQIHDLCYDFGRQMSGANAYSVLDLGRFDYGRVLKKMDPIYDKLGIERMNQGNGGSYNRSNNFLDNTKSSSNSTSIEDVEDLLG